MNIIVGSARHDENGNLSHGKVGDQLQKTVTNDTSGEVSMQKFYVHKKGWYILRPKDKSIASDLACAMQTACNNRNLGYAQDVARKLINITTSKPTNLDCSMLVRACIAYACGIDVGNFTTANEVQVLLKSGLFTKSSFVNMSNTPVYNGDVLVTKTKGHTVIVTQGNPRDTTNLYYPKYVGASGSIVLALGSVGEKDCSYVHRCQIAEKNNILYYTGTAEQNTKMLNLLKKGKLLKP